VTIPEAGTVRRAWLTFAAQSTMALAAVLIIVGGVAWLLLLHDEHVSENRLLRQAVRPAARDDVTDPPPGITLFLVDRTRRVVARTPEMPAVLFDPRGLRAGPSTPVWGGRTVTGTRYRSLTVADGNGWVQAALDLSGRDMERRRVLGVGLAACLIGVLAAGGMGLLLARRAIAPLGEAIERQGRFVADASHELRTPLTLLHTRAQMVRRDLLAGDLERVREEVAALERDAGRMDEVIEDLLLSAELGGGAERTMVDLRALAADAATAVEGYAAGAGVRISPQLEEAWVEGTRAHFGESYSACWTTRSRTPPTPAARFGWSCPATAPRRCSRSATTARGSTRTWHSACSTGSRMARPLEAAAASVSSCARSGGGRGARRPG
jgi:two-component system OmpR family sensor kinase